MEESEVLEILTAAQLTDVNAKEENHNGSRDRGDMREAGA